MQTVYIISGPLGVGKSTVSEALFKAMDGAVLVVGDDLYNLEEESDLVWEEKLQKSWDRILTATRSQLDKGLNIVLDFVVEDELPWFRKQLAKYDLQFRYVVLVADKKTILERLKMRNELKYKDRSMDLLNQLSKKPSNQKHILDTTNMRVEGIVQEIIKSPQYIVI